MLEKDGGSDMREEIETAIYELVAAKSSHWHDSDHRWLAGLPEWFPHVRIEVREIRIKTIIDSERTTTGQGLVLPLAKPVSRASHRSLLAKNLVVPPDVDPVRWLHDQGICWCPDFDALCELANWYCEELT